MKITKCPFLDENHKVSFSSYQLFVFVTSYFAYTLMLYNRKVFVYTLPHILMEKYFSSYEVGKKELHNTFKICQIIKHQMEM